MKRILQTAVILLVPFFLFGQTEKISGTVTAEDGTPLAGANVMIVGTTLGAATDENGNYFILDIPVGTQSLRVDYIGYRSETRHNLLVISGLTTEANFQLVVATIPGEVVEVIAERPLVSKSATSNISVVTAEDIATMPVRGVTNIIALLPSVIVQDGNVHIRGGRSDEVGYYLNGASTVCALSNTNIIYVSQDAIEEIKVLAGGYTAEHGGANAGIVSRELRTGGSGLRYMIDFQTDKFADYEAGEQFLNTYSYGQHIASFTLGGPLLLKNIRFFVAGENNSQADWIRRFSEGYEFTRVDDNPLNKVHDTVTVAYPDGFTPGNRRERLNLNGTLLFDYSPLKLRLSATYTNRRNYFESTPMLTVLNERERYDDLTSLLATSKLTYFLTPKSFLEVNAYLFDYKWEYGDSYFGHDWQSWHDSAAVAEHTKGEVIYRNAWQPPYAYRMNGLLFAANGMPAGNGIYSSAPREWFYSITTQGYLGGAANFVSQMAHHELKLGVDAKQYTVRDFSINPEVMLYAADSTVSPVTGYTQYGDPETVGPDVMNVPVKQWMTFGGVSAYGYDLYGNEIDEEKIYGTETDTTQPIYIDAPKRPTHFSAYLQDKIEFNDLIINLGLRYDYFDTDDKKLKNPASPQVDAASAMILRSEWEDVEPFVEISPRIGLSFPVTDRTVFYLGYGKFVQMSELDHVYRSTFSMSRQIYQGGFYYLSPVGFGLEPLRTTSYEVGFRQQITPSSAFDITGFYKNVRGLITIDKQASEPGGDITEAYERLVNGDFATTKGLEFRFTLRRTKRLSAMMNYTLTDAEGTASTEDSYHSASYNNTIKPTVVSPLDFSQTHTGAVMLDYRFGKGDGGPLLSQLGANLLLTFSSGHPYTFVYATPGGQVDAYSAATDYMYDTRSRQALEPIGHSRTPWTFNVDLRIDKTISLAGHDITFYGRVTNLFNRKNPINVFERTGSAYDDGFLGDPAYSGAFIETYGKEDYVELYNAINVVNGQAYWDQIDRQLYGHPRQIFFGIRISR